MNRNKTNEALTNLCIGNIHSFIFTLIENVARNLMQSHSPSGRVQTKSTQTHILVSWK